MQVLQLQGELELRDARIVELEEANEKMDAVLQVIQAQLGGDPMQHHHDLHGMGLDPAAEELPAPDLGEGGTPLAAAAAGGDEEQQQAQQEGVGGVEVLDDERNRAGAATGSCAAAGAGAGAQERPLWASVLELHGDLSLTALQVMAALLGRGKQSSASCWSSVRGLRVLKPWSMRRAP